MILACLAVVANILNAPEIDLSKSLPLLQIHVERPRQVVSKGTC